MLTSEFKCRLHDVKIHVISTNASPDKKGVRAKKAMLAFESKDDSYTTSWKHRPVENM